MKETSTELKVGIFAIVVIIFLSYITFKVGGLPLFREKGYRLYLTLDDTSGLDEQSRVKIAGVDTGVVDKIVLQEGKARLTLLISPGISVYKNAVAALKMSGLLGDRYIAISSGSPDQPILEDGAEIENIRPAADIDSLASQLTSAAHYIRALTENIESIFGAEEREAIKDSIHDLRVVTRSIKEISVENREPLRSLIAKLDNFSQMLNDKGPKFMDDMSMVARVLGDRGPALIDNMDRTASALREILEENKESFKDSMENMKYVSNSARTIVKKLEEGEGSLGKLMTEDSLYDSIDQVAKEAGKSFDVVSRLKTYLDFHTEYNLGESEWKGYFDLTIQPREDYYYVLGVVTDPMGSVDRTETTINNGVTME